MAEWRDVTLGEATVSLDSRRKPVKATDRLAGPYPYYGASGIVDSVDSWLFDETTLLVSEDGENLRTRKTPIAFLASGRYWVNNHAHVLKAASGFDLRFLNYALQTADVSGYLTGSTQPKLTAGNLGSIRLRAPEHAEQRRIAGVLGALDDLIDADVQQAGVLEEQARALAMTATAVAQIGHLARLADSKQVRPVGLVEHYSLPAFDTGRHPDIVDGAEIQSSKLRLQQKCVLVSRLNPKWERCWMVYPGSNSMASTEFVPLVPVGVEAEELWAITSAPPFWEELRARVTGTTGSHQRVDKAAVLLIVASDTRTLSSDQRAAIVALVQGAHALRQEGQELRTARDELLSELMSGRIRVTDEFEAA